MLLVRRAKRRSPGQTFNQEEYYFCCLFLSPHDWQNALGYLFPISSRRHVSAMILEAGAGLVNTHHYVFSLATIEWTGPGHCLCSTRSPEPGEIRAAAHPGLQPWGNWERFGDLSTDTHFQQSIKVITFITEEVHCHLTITPINNKF